MAEFSSTRDEPLSSFLVSFVFAVVGFFLFFSFFSFFSFLFVVFFIFVVLLLTT